MVAGNYYRMKLNWGEYHGGALVRLWWSYGGVGKTVIPSSAYYYPEFVGSSPYQVTVSCPPGYNGNTVSNPNT